MVGRLNDQFTQNLGFSASLFFRNCLPRVRFWIRYDAKRRPRRVLHSSTPHKQPLLHLPITPRGRPSNTPPAKPGGVPSSFHAWPRRGDVHRESATRSRFQLRPEKRDLPGHARERREVQLIRRSRTAGRHATAALPPAAGGEAVSRGGEGGGLAGACGAGARAGTIAV